MLSSAAAAPTEGRAPGAQTFGDLHAQLHAMLGIRLAERLRIGVGDHELHTIEGLLDHVVHGVAPGPANTENGDAGLEIVMSGYCKVECHCFVRLSL